MPLPAPAPVNSLLATNRLLRTQVWHTPLEPRCSPMPLSRKIVLRMVYPEKSGLVCMPGPAVLSRSRNPSQVMRSSASRTPPVTSDSPSGRRVRASRPHLAPLMVSRRVLTVTVSW